MTLLARPELATAPYIARNELFGCFIYERATGRYFALDKDMLALLRESKRHSLDEVYEIIYGTRAAAGNSETKNFRTDFDQLIKIFESGGIMKDGRYCGIFLDNEVPSGCKSLVAPTEVNLQLTAKCPNSCNYCWIKRTSTINSGDEMRTEEVKALLCNLVQAGTYVVNFCGGCAISRSDFAALVKYANSLGMCVNLSIEGAALDKKRIDMLADLNIRSYRLGLVAGTDKVWENIRGVGGSSQRSFVSKVKSLVSKLRSIKSTAKISFRATVVEANRDELSTLISKLNNLMRDLDIAHVDLHLNPALPIGTRQGGDSRIFLSTERVMNFLDWIKDYRARQTAGDPVNIVSSAEVPPSPPKKTLEGFCCECGFNSCFISSQGFMYPSAAVMGVIDNKELVNLRKYNFDIVRVWQMSSLFHNFRGQVANDVCKSCPEYASCHGGCRSRALLNNPKSWRAMDPWCRLAYDKAKKKEVSLREHNTHRS